jgi:diguanylate cyclase (GGDEF)-like protein
VCVADLFAELAHTHAFESLHDALTGLANRRLFLARLRTAQKARETHGATAVLFVDVDDFKTINDALGHEAGNEALIAVGARLCSVVRPGDTVARLGGDEFGVLIEALANREALLSTVERIVATLGQPLSIADTRIAISVSVGVALGEEASSAETALRNADLAMYAAKRRHKGGYAFYEDGMHARARARLDLRSQLENALERGELFLLFQPIVGLRGRAVIGAEALLRWRREDRGIVEPAEFIPICEQTGLIGPIGHWVLEEACRQAVRWGSAKGRRGPMRVSVNISPRQLQDADLVAAVTRALDVSGLEPGELILEITENVFIRDMETALARLHELKRLGVRLALDDFGAGFSSLGYLSRMPIDVLKLDRAFIAQLGSADERGLLAGVVALARSLELETVAEGIETDEQARELEAAGCTYGQGFFFARPMDSGILGRLAAQAQALPVASSLVQARVA